MPFLFICLFVFVFVFVCLFCMSDDSFDRINANKFVFFFLKILIYSYQLVIWQNSNHLIIKEM